MAFGDQVQAAVGVIVDGGTTNTAALTSLPTVGSLMLSGFNCAGPGTPNINTEPGNNWIPIVVGNTDDGTSNIADAGGEVKGWYKIAGEGESDDITVGYDASDAGLWIAEIEWDGSTPDTIFAASASSDTTNVASQSTGTTSASVPAGALAVASWYVAENGMSIANYTNGFVEILEVQGSSGGVNQSFAVATLVTGAAGAVESTADGWTPNDERLKAFVVTFAQAGGTPATATPAAAGVAVGIPAVTVVGSVEQAATPADVVAAVPAAAASGGGSATASPNAVDVPAAVPAASASGGTNATATPAAVDVVGAVPAASVSGQIPSLSTDEIGIIGHSNTSTFVDYYRIDSTQDLIVSLNQGSQDAQSWGDPTHGDFAAAWAELEGGEPVGGYKAIEVFLGFKQSWEGTFDATDFEAWADEIHSQITTRFPTVEYIWWSPMNTYFSTNPGDGDSFDLVALDPWGTNPTGISTWKASDIESQRSWETLEYAIAQGYADDYGPWINLTDAETDVDNRHPTEPGGAEHGADVLLNFFETSAGNAVATPSAVDASAGIPQATVTGTGDAVATPDAVDVAGAVPQATLAASVEKALAAVAVSTGIPAASLSATVNVSASTISITATVPLVTLLTGLELAITALSFAQFHRIDGNLVLSPIGRSTRKGFRTSEGFERVSDIFRIDNHPDGEATTEDAMLAVASAWSANSGAAEATLKSAIHAALDSAGFRASDGSQLT